MTFQIVPPEIGCKGDHFLYVNQNSCGIHNEKKYLFPKKKKKKNLISMLQPKYLENNEQTGCDVPHNDDGSEDYFSKERIISISSQRPHVSSEQ